MTQARWHRRELLELAVTRLAALAAMPAGLGFASLGCGRPPPGPTGHAHTRSTP